MDYHLQNLRTGETHPLQPHRTLIGSADHAAIRTRTGSPYLAALTVRYPSGWSLHGLADDPAVLFNGTALRVTRQVMPRPGDLLEVDDDRFRFAVAGGSTATAPPSDKPTPTCLAYIRNPDGKEECRTVDHDLLFGRLPVCHVRFPDTRLSRLNALLAAHAGAWYLHALSKNPVARNRELITGFVPVEDGDELIVGPLVVRLEIRPAAPDAPPPVPAAAMETPTPHSPTATDEMPGQTVEAAYPIGPDTPANLTALREAGMKLDHWLRGQKLATTPQGGGLGGWIGAQRARLNRFWYDTPETTAARGLRTAGRPDDAFAILERAIRARPDSPELLRELYRLYEAVGLADLCYRPLRVIEKLAAARGQPDTWVLESLARLCERLGRDRPSMFDRAVNYWSKLETASGISYARERNSAMAQRTLRESGLAGPRSTADDSFD